MAENVRHDPGTSAGVVRATSVALVVAAAAATGVLFLREHRANARQVEQLQRDIQRGPVARITRVKLAPPERVVSLLAEVRAYGQGIMIVDQIPTKLAPDVIKNTGLKIAHRIVSGDDRAVLTDDPVPLIALSRSGVRCSGLDASFGPAELLSAW